MVVFQSIFRVFLQSHVCVPYKAVRMNDNVICQLINAAPYDWQEYIKIVLHSYAELSTFGRHVIIYYCHYHVKYI